MLVVAFVGVAILAAVAVVWRQRDDVSAAFARLSTAAILGSLAAGLGAGYATMLCWRTLLADLGARLALPAAGRVYFLGQLGKYVPGSVWSVLAQMELGRDYAVRRTTSAAAGTLLLVLAATCGLAVAVAILPFAGLAGLDQFRWLAAAAIPLLVLLHPGVQQWLVRLAGRILRRRIELPRMSGRGIALATGWILLAWLLFGVHLHLLVVSACGCSDHSLLLSTGVFALAWVSGFLVVIAPAGAGVREGVLVFGLAATLDPAAALVVALVSRVLVTGSDLALAAVAVAGARRHARPPTIDGSSRKRGA